MSLTVIVVHDLEVLDRGLGDTAVEVEHVGLRVVVPHRRLVVQLDEVVQRAAVPPAQQALLLLHTHTRSKSLALLHALARPRCTFAPLADGKTNIIQTPNCIAHHVKHTRTRTTHILRPDSDPFKIHVHARDDDGHLARPFESQHIGLLWKKNVPLYFFLVSFFESSFYTCTVFWCGGHPHSRRRPVPAWCCSPPVEPRASWMGCYRCQTP